MKKWMKKALLSAFTLTFLCGAALTASAEENGYWAMQRDWEGIPVMVYTYTDGVDFTVEDRIPLETVSAPEEIRLSSVRELSAGQASASAGGDSLGAMAVLGIVSLAAAAFVLYRAI